jgi:hypothetical protein
MKFEVCPPEFKDKCELKPNCPRLDQMNAISLGILAGNKGGISTEEFIGHVRKNSLGFFGVYPFIVFNSIEHCAHFRAIILFTMENDISCGL